LNQTLTAISKTRLVAPLIPYITIAIGFLILHNAWISILSYHLGMVLVLLLAGEKIRFRLIWKSRNHKVLIFSTILGILGGLLLYLLWPFLGIPADINQFLHDIGLTTSTWPCFIAYFILVNPWLEEYYWRGYLGSDSKRLTLNDLIFSGYHVLVMVGTISAIWVLIVFVVLCLGAWFWRQVNHWNQGLLTSIVSHVTADASVIFTIYFMTTV
jgi:uncharacterized protein